MIRRRPDPCCSGKLIVNLEPGKNPGMTGGSGAAVKFNLILGEPLGAGYPTTLNSTSSHPEDPRRYPSSRLCTLTSWVPATR